MHFPLDHITLAFLCVGASACGARHSEARPASAPEALSPAVAVAPQYDTSHVYVAPADVDPFASSFLATFGGTSSKQVVATVTPTPSRTSSQLLRTPVGTVSLFGFETPIPAPFGSERTGYLVTDLDAAIRSARASGASVIVEPFLGPIGKDAVIQWPGGVDMQLYWHFSKPAAPALRTVPENRVYLSPDRADDFLHAFANFAQARTVSDERSAPGVEIGRPGETYRRVRLESAFGKLLALVSDGHLPYPYGHETTGYDVASLGDTLAKARAAGVSVLVEPFASAGRESAMVLFRGGYVAEVHSEQVP